MVRRIFYAREQEESSCADLIDRVLDYESLTLSNVKSLHESYIVGSLIFSPLYEFCYLLSITGGSEVRTYGPAVDILQMNQRSRVLIHRAFKFEPCKICKGNAGSLNLSPRVSMSASVGLQAHL